ncbi:hypothetical protein FALCPG4_015191 [Fusarium falciforme]
MTDEHEPIPNAPGSTTGTFEPDDSQSDAESAASNLSTTYYVGLKEELLAALSNIQASGSFASFAGISNTPPALFVDGVGDVTMPLSESQARQLIARARQAPYGKGSETLVDTAVRNTWELDAEQFAFRAPAWAGFIKSLCAHTSQRLGINTPITAEIYKMLVYEKGAMFKAHTDTEKIPGMFGTLVVSLPSAHQGGDLVLKHCGEKKVFKTSEWAQSFACWYSDVSHEVLPVTSGYRWVLTYNLALDQTLPRPSATGLQLSQFRPLRHTLRRWLAEDQESRKQKFLYHILDHDYTEANASLNALKAQDLARVQALKEACSKLPVDIFLALLEKQEMGSVEFDYYDRGYRRRGYWDDYDDEDESGFHALEEVFELSYKVKTLVDLEGRIVTKDLHLDEDDILEEDCFEDLEAEEEYEGYMGNSGPTATHWYRATAVVIVPRDSATSYFDCSKQTHCSLSHNFYSPIGYYARACLLPQAGLSSATALLKLWEQVWGERNKKRYGSLDGEAMRDVLKVAVQRGLYDLFEKAAVRHQGLLLPDFFSWVRQWLGTGDGDPNERFNAIKKGLCFAISGYPYFADHFRAIANLVPIPEDATASDNTHTPQRVLGWARSTLRSCLDGCVGRGLGGDDGTALVDSALYFSDPSAFLSQTATSIVDRKRIAAAFCLRFLARLEQQSTKGTLPVESSMHLYRTIASYFIRMADFEQVKSEVRVRAAAKRARLTGAGQDTKAQLRTAIGHETLADFFSTILRTSAEGDGLLAQLVSKLVAEAPGLLGLELHYFWLPFLRSLIPILTSNAIPLDTERYQKLFSTFFKAYLDNFVGLEPGNNQDLVRNGVRCSCFDCGVLNGFLTDPARMIGHFSVNKQRRMHLHRQLDSSGVDCTHETERSGSPQTLVVTKTFRYQVKRHQDWASRRTLAATKIGIFEHDHLRLLLGPDYFAIVHMERISAAHLARAPAAASTTGQPRQPLADTSQQGTSQPPVVGEKRKLPPAEYEIIDLTSD